MNKIICVLFAFFFSVLSFADFKSDLVGEWDYFDSGFESHFYVYLKLNEDFSGVLARSKDGEKDIYPLTNKEIKIHDGYIEISVVDNSEKKIIFVVSAWRNKLSSMLTGNMFLYNKTKQGLALFNTINLTMLPSNGLELSKEIKLIHKHINDKF